MADILMLVKIKRYIRHHRIYKYCMLHNFASLNYVGVALELRKW